MPCRYLGPMRRDRHAVAVRVGDEHEVAVTYRDNGTCLTNDYDLIQDPEVIEFKRWVNIDSDLCVEVPFCLSSSQHYVPNGADVMVVPITIRITGDKVEISGGTE